MGNSVYLSKKSKVRSHKQESIIIVSAKYIHDFVIAINFSNVKTKLVDFLPLFHKYVKGENQIYFAPDNLKKFVVQNGNIYWGNNEDVIFPIEMLFNKRSNNKQKEVLYII